MRLITTKNYCTRALVTALFAIVLGACNDFGDTNIDPIRSSNLDPEKQLNLVQLSYSGGLGVNERTSVMLTMPLVQHVGGIWANRYGQFYIYNKPYMAYPWENTFNAHLLNIVDAVERTNAQDGQSNLNAICRIMKVYLFARFTDLYGDIPYSEAGKGYNEGIVRPVYDRQEDIYNDFFKELSEASAQLDPSADNIENDFFYDGNIEAWRKFANSLHLRLAMRLVKVDPQRAKEEAKKAYDAGVLENNSETCMMQHEDIQNDYQDIRGNGLSAALNQSEELSRISNTLIDIMRESNDPRLPEIARYYKTYAFRPFDRTDITQQVSEVIGFTGVNSNEYLWDNWQAEFEITLPSGETYMVTNNEQKAQIANFLIANNAPYLHLTYAEVEFLLADATLRFGQEFGESAQGHYENGVRAALQQLSFFPGGPTFTDTQIDDFIQSVPLIPGRELEVVNTQLWIALLLNGPEAFANWRRTGYPVLPSSVTGESTTTTTPRRFEYPLTEQEQNAIHYQEAVDRLGGEDTWNARVWWDVEQ
ncbi:SusD/RagB family nutrient-binding outer membrane lipoprotein [Sinomicrobium sp. M5D2P17]